VHSPPPLTGNALGAGRARERGGGWFGEPRILSERDRFQRLLPGPLSGMVSPRIQPDFRTEPRMAIFWMSRTPDA
jgi:hypothetical protein